MSIPVELDKVADEVTARGAGYLLTSREDGRPHSTQVTFAIADGTLRAPAGRTTAANVARVGLVSLLWPPTEEGGYSLIIDGDATVDGDDGDRYAVITPTHAVLHRPAPSGTGNDCKAP